MNNNSLKKNALDLLGAEVEKLFPTLDNNLKAVVAASLLSTVPYRFTDTFSLCLMINAEKVYKNNLTKEQELFQTEGFRTVVQNFLGPTVTSN